MGKVHCGSHPLWLNRSFTTCDPPEPEPEARREEKRPGQKRAGRWCGAPLGEAPSDLSSSWRTEVEAMLGGCCYCSRCCCCCWLDQIRRLEVAVGGKGRRKIVSGRYHGGGRSTSLESEHLTTTTTTTSHKHLREAHSVHDARICIHRTSSSRYLHRSFTRHRHVNSQSPMRL